MQYIETVKQFAVSLTLHAEFSLLAAAINIVAIP